MNKNIVKSIIESLLFMWGEPLSVNEIKKVIEIEKSELLEIIIELQNDYQKDSTRGIELKQFGNTYQFVTKKTNYEYVSKLFDNAPIEKNLSNAAIETLSIIAYKQPVTRIEIEAIRGVKSSSIIKGLLDKDLVKEVGRLDKIGRPHLYGTTNLFLKHFDLKTLQDLPEIEKDN